MVLGCPPGLTAQGALLFTSPGTVWAGSLVTASPTSNVYYSQIIAKSSAQLLIGGCHIEAEVIRAVMEQCSGRWKCSPGMGLDSKHKVGSTLRMGSPGITPLGFRYKRNLSKSLQCVIMALSPDMLCDLLKFLMIWAVPPHSVWFPFCTGGYGPFQ